MLRLDLDRAPRWIDILGGQVRMKVAPVTSAVMLAAISDLAGQEIDREDVGAWHVALVKAIARRVIEDWQGFGDAADEPAPVSAATVDAAMDLHRVFGAFDAQVVAPYLALQVEKKSSAPLPDGTSDPAPTTAATATDPARSAPAG